MRKQKLMKSRIRSRKLDMKWALTYLLIYFINIAKHLMEDWSYKFLPAKGFSSGKKVPQLQSKIREVADPDLPIVDPVLWHLFVFTLVIFTQIQSSMTLTDMGLTEFMGLTEKIPTTEPFM